MFWGSDRWPIHRSLDVVREIESLGFGSLFFPEGSGKDSLVQAAAFLSATERLIVGTGISNVHLRHPTLAEGGARTLSALHPGRFVLGLGVSHREAVETTFGLDYGSPLATMRAYLAKMDELSPEIEPESIRAPRLLAALGPRLMEVAVSYADGVHSYLTSPHHTHETRVKIGADRLLVVEQSLALTEVGTDALELARAHLAPYLRLQNYRQSWLRQGFSEADLCNGGSERLVRSIVAVGPIETVARTVEEHLQAGADQVVIQPLRANTRDTPLPALRQVAAALDLPNRNRAFGI